MKLSTFIQAVALMLLLAIAASSCKSSRQSRQSPRENPPVVVVKEENLPPGQAKKIYGDKSAKDYAPGQQKKKAYSRNYPLIIIRTPDIVIKRYTDGRYYYLNPEGYYYWQGSDNRFYLDESHLSKVDYNDDDYKDWKNKGHGNSDKKDNSGNGNSDKKENGNNGNGNGNSDKKENGNGNSNGKGNSNKDQKKNKG